LLFFLLLPSASTFSLAQTSFPLSVFLVLPRIPSEIGPSHQFTQAISDLILRLLKKNLTPQRFHSPGNLFWFILSLQPHSYFWKNWHIPPNASCHLRCSFFGPTPDQITLIISHLSWSSSCSPIFQSQSTQPTLWPYVNNFFPLFYVDLSIYVVLFSPILLFLPSHLHIWSCCSHLQKVFVFRYIFFLYTLMVVFVCFVVTPCQIDVLL
jgi:hypothetical protein